jgi:hypothetical protein
LLRRIQTTGQTGTCFDVFAWYGGDVLFCEAKRYLKNRFTDPQLRFIQAALACDITSEALLVIEWDLAEEAPI